MKSADNKPVIYFETCMGLSLKYIVENATYSYNYNVII